MTRFYFRCLLILAVSQLLFGSHLTLHADEWDPFSQSVGVGSFKISTVYQGYLCAPIPPLKLEENSASYRRRLEAWGHTCPKATYPQNLAEDCYQNSDDDEGEHCLAIPERSKSPSAFELEFGNTDVDLTTSQGTQDDLFFVTVAYRHYLQSFFDKSRLRIFAAIGVGAYFLEPDEKFGYNVKLGTEIGAWKMKDGKPYWPFEIGATYHRLDSGFDFTDVTFGIRLHRPQTFR